LDKKNIILIVILAVVVIFYFQIMEYLGFYEPANETQQPIQDTTTAIATPADSSVPLATQQIPTEQQPTGATAGQAVGTVAAAVPDSVSHDTIVVNTNVYSVAMTSFGGGPVSLILNKHKYRDKTPIEMLPEATAATPEATFAGGTFSTSQINYSSSVPPGQYNATSTPLEIVYTYSTGDGGEIIK
jgi:YidC/Oxa1 family membrane protein insertase